MKKIVDWLIGNETILCQIYTRAAEVFKSDSRFAGLLTQLSEDEKVHHDFLRDCKKYLKDFPLLISLDDDLKQTVERPFRECRKKLDDGTLSKKEMLRYMVVMEFTELNHLFLYAINSLKGRGRGSEESTAEELIEEHKDRLKRFIESEPDAIELLKNINKLPDASSDRILIVDDESTNVDLIKAVVSKLGRIDTANNGEEALKKIRLKYFSAIVLDVDMPGMNGIEFYTKAVEMIPVIKERFLFIIDEFDADRLTFFRDNNLAYLMKPLPISEIRKAVKDMMDQRASS